jgi:hypothetical protein
MSTVLVPDELVLDDMEYRMSVVLVPDELVLDDMECGYRMTVQVPVNCRTFS